MDKKTIKEQAKTRTIDEMAELYNVSHGTMWNVLHKIGYKPKKRGRKAKFKI